MRQSRPLNRQSNEFHTRNIRYQTICCQAGRTPVALAGLVAFPTYPALFKGGNSPNRE